MVINGDLTNDPLVAFDSEASKLNKKLLIKGHLPHHAGIPGML